MARGVCESQPSLSGQDAAPCLQLAACQRWTAGFVLHGVEAARCPRWDGMGLLLFLGAPPTPSAAWDAGAAFPAPALGWDEGFVGCGYLLALSEALRRALAASSSPLAAPAVKKLAPPFANYPGEWIAQHRLSNPYKILCLGPAQLGSSHPAAAFPTLQAVGAESPARCRGQSRGWSQQQAGSLLPES